MKRLFFIGSVIFYCNSFFGQVSVQTQSEADAMNDPKVVELKRRHDQAAEKQGRAKSASFYMGYDDVLRSYFVGNSIPAETPKADPAFSQKQYVALLNDWLRKNQQFLKPEHKNSLITE